MAVNFTVIFPSRQHFGNEANIFQVPGAEGAPFVGKTKDFSFDCPGVNPNETAVLLFQSYDVEAENNIFQINGVDVFGGLPVGREGEQTGSHRKNGWVGNVVLVENRHQLRATGNAMHIESKAPPRAPGDIDDFILDNMVIMYKAAATGPVIR
jgi:hypothetical protein